ncbi:hypothetical protein DF046_05320 [Burkholderia cepacia]|nr:hypothetical protein DF046_05320 [Burkholderia cepacia]
MLLLQFYNNVMLPNDLLEFLRTILLEQPTDSQRRKPFTSNTKETKPSRQVNSRIYLFIYT